jgi:hypothetical protein
MIRLEPLTIAHLAALGLPEHADKLDSGLAWALIHDDKPVAAGGVIVPHEGLGIVWCNIESCRRSMFLMRRIHFAAGERFDRLQADVLYEDKKACAWPRRFGMRYEGKMPMYHQGKTFLRFAWTRTTKCLPQQ